MAKLISKTYGEALFELAVEENRVDLFLEEIQAIRTILLENPDFSALMNHPKITKEEKIQLINEIFKTRIDDELTGFLTLVVTKDRYRHIDEILGYFLDQVKALKEIGVAYVTTAAELKEDQKQKIVQRILETTSYQKMEMNYRVNKELIGGMIIRIGDRVVDSSIQTKLWELQKQLMSIQLA